MTLSSVKEVEKWIKNNATDEIPENILLADAPSEIAYGFYNTNNDSFIKIAVTDAHKSKFIMDLRKEILYNVRRKAAERDLKQAYKEAIDCGVEVRMTANWFGDMNEE